jgi:hypothetical protein
MMRQLLCRFLFAISLLLPAGQLAYAAETVRPPEVVVSEFYQWYMKELAADRNPLIDNNKSLSNYVAASLLQQIKRQMNSKDGMENDYFIQAQDYLDDWVTSIAVATPAVNGDVATTKLTLGATDQSRSELEVTLRRERSEWKITKVQPHGKEKRVLR